MPTQITLTRRIEKIKKVFDLEPILQRDACRSGSIARYYRLNRWAYNLFHSRTGLIHMAISRNGKYKTDDLYAPARLVAQYIAKTKAKRILELAAGRGANSIYLAREFSHCQFAGLDLPQGQLDPTKRIFRRIENLKVGYGDFHNLRAYRPLSFDLVFVIESLCYSQNKEKVLGEVRRLLKPDGLLIIIDGYLKKPPHSLTPEEKLTKELVARGMMVWDFEYYPDFIKKCQQTGYQILFQEDVSQMILPNLERFEKMVSRRIFNRPRLGKLIVRLFPLEFTANTISAYLMPLAVTLDLAIYTILVLQKHKL